jgi:hypothetical protein
MSKMRLGSTEQIAIVQEHLASHDSGVSECLWVSGARIMQQQQQHADYDLLAVFNDEARADTAAAKLRKEGFNEEEVHQLTEGSIGRGQFREHGPNRTRGDFFLQTQRAKPKPALIILFAIIFGIVLGALSLISSFALPTIPEPVTLIVCVIIGLIIGALFGMTRRRIRGAIGQDLSKSTAPPAPKNGARTVVALRFSDPENISRISRARAILINNQGKIDRSVGRRE